MDGIVEAWLVQKGSVRVSPSVMAARPGRLSEWEDEGGGTLEEFERRLRRMVRPFVDDGADLLAPEAALRAHHIIELPTREAAALLDVMPPQEIAIIVPYMVCEDGRAALATMSVAKRAAVAAAVSPTVAAAANLVPTRGASASGSTVREHAPRDHAACDHPTRDRLPYDHFEVDGGASGHSTESSGASKPKRPSGGKVDLGKALGAAGAAVGAAGIAGSAAAEKARLGLGKVAESRDKAKVVASNAAETARQTLTQAADRAAATELGCRAKEKIATAQAAAKQGFAQASSRFAGLMRKP